MLAAAAFAVIRIADDHPWLPRGPILTGRLRRRETIFTGVDIRRLADLARISVGRPVEQVVAEFIQMSTKVQPWTGGRDVVGRRLAAGFQHDWHTGEVMPIPC